MQAFEGLRSMTETPGFDRSSAKENERDIDPVVCTKDINLIYQFKKGVVSLEILLYPSSRTQSYIPLIRLPVVLLERDQSVQVPHP